METEIKAVLFDLGGTLEDLSSTEEQKRACIQKVRRVLDRAAKTDTFAVPEEEFYENLMAGYRQYKEWTVSTNLEKSPEEIWADHYLVEYSQEQELIWAMADRLTQLWETIFYTRSMKDGVPRILEELKARGLKLGLISNTTSRTVPFELLEQYGIDAFFDCVLLSAVEGCRKPGTAMFEKACGLLGVEAGQCVYVGDQVAKDIAGAYGAGYRAGILIDSDFTTVDPRNKNPFGCLRIQKLAELPGLLDSQKL